MSKFQDLRYGEVYERAAAQCYIEKAFPGAVLIKPPRYADLDWLVVNAKGELVAALEIKARRLVSTAFESTIVAIRKHHAARYFREFWKLPSLCLVLFTDTAAVFKLNEAPDAEGDIIARGRAVPHAHYNHTRFEWHPDVFERTTSLVAAQQGLAELAEGFLSFGDPSQDG